MRKSLLSRPVNALRKIYEPAYLGAKIQAQDSTPLQIKILEGALKKKLNSSEDWSYKDFFVFKGFDEEGNKEYRKCLAPSPSTATAEAYLLSQLAEIRDKLRLSNVYSYCLASQNSSTNYEYYLSHYVRRNDDVLAALSESSRDVAVCFDIRQFYPSVHTDLLQKKLVEFSGRYAELHDLTAFVDFSLHQLTKAEVGIPIGTEISHQLADIFLHDFDVRFSQKHKNKYFRYVDDITIVCDKAQVDSVSREIAAEVQALGLSLNDRKFAVYDSTRWCNEISNAAVDGEDFLQHCEKLSKWLRQKEIDPIEVSRQFRDEGFNLPFEKIVARKTPVRDISALDFSTQEVVAQTRELKEKYRTAAESMMGIEPEDHTRGSLQKARRALNPLFYLLDVSEYDLISEVASTHKNLITQKVVSTAFLEGLSDGLLDYPGATVSSYCEIWKTLGQEKPCSLSSIRVEQLERHRQDSLTAFLLHGLVSPKDDIYRNQNWLYLRPNVERRTLGIDKFDGEIESLRISISLDEQSKILSKRQSEDEEIDLQALELGNQSISP